MGQDADFTDERFETRYTGDLGKKLGNLVQRTLKMIHSYRQGVVPNYDGFHLDPSSTPRCATTRSWRRTKRHVAEFRAAPRAAGRCGSFVAQANEYIEKTQPFKLAKDPAQAKRLDVILALLAETLRRLSVLVQDALPFTAQKIRKQMQLPDSPRRLDEARFGNSLRGHVLGEPRVLFPPVEPSSAA